MFGGLQIVLVIAVAMGFVMGAPHPNHSKADVVARDVEGEGINIRSANQDDCIDKYDDCESDKAYCDDPSYKDLIIEYCPRTYKCADNHRDCRNYKSFCSIDFYKDFMVETCPLTCHVC